MQHRRYMDLMAVSRHSNQPASLRSTIAEISLPAYVHEARLLLSCGGVPVWPNPARYLIEQRRQGVVFPLLTATSLLRRLCLVLHKIVECRRSWEPRR
jgi:hypothetical protein